MFHVASMGPRLGARKIPNPRRTHRIGLGRFNGAALGGAENLLDEQPPSPYLVY